MRCCADKSAWDLRPLRVALKIFTNVERNRARVYDATSEIDAFLTEIVLPIRSAAFTPSTIREILTARVARASRDSAASTRSRKCDIDRQSSLG